MVIVAMKGCCSYMKRVDHLTYRDPYQESYYIRFCCWKEFSGNKQGPISVGCRGLGGADIFEDTFCFLFTRVCRDIPDKIQYMAHRSNGFKPEMLLPKFNFFLFKSILVSTWICGCWVHLYLIDAYYSEKLSFCLQKKKFWWWNTVEK